jgi:hypothetical protein
LRNWVLSVSSRALLEACGRLGLDTRRILEAAKIEAATVQDPDARISIDRVNALWQTAYELSGDPNLALHAIEVLPFGACRVIDFLASSAPTIGAAVAKVSDYFPLINGLVRLPYAVGDRDVAIALEAPSRPSVITRPYAEYTLAAVFLRTRIATKQRYALIRVEFSHARPADIREHERIFECPVAFGADRCQMVIARAVWDTPRTDSDPTLFAVLDAHARMLLDRLPTGSDIVGRVREALEAELRGRSEARIDCQAARDEPANAAAPTEGRARRLQRDAGRDAVSRGEVLPRSARHRWRGSRLSSRVRRAQLVQPCVQALVRPDAHRIPPSNCRRMTRG